MSKYLYFPNQENVFQDPKLTQFFKNRRILLTDIERNVEQFILEQSFESKFRARSWMLGEPWKKTLLSSIVSVGTRGEEAFQPHMIQDIELTLVDDESLEDDEF